MSDTNETIRPTVIGVGEPFVTAHEKEIGYTIDGRRVVNFRGYWWLLSENNEINLDGAPVAIDEVTRHRRQTTQTSRPNHTPPLANNTVSNKPNRIAEAELLQARRRLNSSSLSIKRLQMLAFLGIERAIVELSLRNGVRASTALRRCVSFRPRYVHLQVHDTAKKKRQQTNLQTTAKAITGLPFKYFLQPIGIGRFKNLYGRMDRAHSNQDIIDILNGRNENIALFDVPNFFDQAAASIIFHSETFKVFGNPHLEHETLPGLFSDKRAVEAFFWNNSNKLQQLKSYNPALVMDDGVLTNALIRVSSRLKPKIKRWREDTYQKFLTTAASLPRTLRLSTHTIKLEDKSYPEVCSKLSIYVLYDLMPSQHMREKLILLHQNGLRHVGDLIVFHPSVRNLVLN